MDRIVECNDSFVSKPQKIDEASELDNARESMIVTVERTKHCIGLLGNDLVCDQTTAAVNEPRKYCTLISGCCVSC
jgi:hypothetical protein